MPLDPISPFLPPKIGKAGEGGNLPKTNPDSEWLDSKTVKQHQQWRRAGWGSKPAAATTSELPPAAAASKAQTYRWLTILRKRLPTKLTETHPHPEEDACLVPLVKCKLTRVIYSPNGFHKLS